MDTADALLLLDLLAGELPQGMDAICRRLLAHPFQEGVAAGMAGLDEALQRTSSTLVSATCFLESVVGSRKARGRPATDNEDAAGAEESPSGTTCLALFDGVTGNGDGSGRTAAVAALDEARHQWARDPERSPQSLLSALELAVRRSTKEGSSTAVLATVNPSGIADVVSVGDSSAWLIRPQGRGHPADASAPEYYAWKLTSNQTVFAHDLLADPDCSGGESTLTSYLGGSVDTYTACRFKVCAGDLLLIASDGATCSEGADVWFGDVLTETTAELVAHGRPPAPSLAAALTARAERLGGWDNATALVTSIGRRRGPGAPSIRTPAAAFDDKGRTA
ncbi:hypothetical protein [Actinacidiphila glaucinigra]|uniref:PP2C family protein-serine/threonine phosphatase n=1 Tax=Actinacidiphila glaucinigra TaxID=235986 RepID=UPI002E344BA8|nr:hypothetical protein [Actinacidiphila glaucinigra]